MVALTVAQLGAAVLGWRLCRAARPGVALLVWEARAPLGPLVQGSWLLALLTGLGVLSQRVGVVLLSSLAGDAPAGWFAAGRRSFGSELSESQPRIPTIRHAR